MPLVLWRRPTLTPVFPKKRKSSDLRLSLCNLFEGNHCRRGFLLIKPLKKPLHVSPVSLHHRCGSMYTSNMESDYWRRLTPCQLIFSCASFTHLSKWFTSYSLQLDKQFQSLVTVAWIDWRRGGGVGWGEREKTWMWGIHKALSPFVSKPSH